MISMIDSLRHVTDQRVFMGIEASLQERYNEWADFDL